MASLTAASHVPDSSMLGAITAERQRLSLLLLLFAFLSVVFFLLLIFLRIPFPAYPLISYQDVFDLLTPIVLLPIYWLLFKAVARDLPSLREEMFFIVLASVWVLGHGMHLAANSVDNLAEALARGGQIDITGTRIYQLTYFFDEHLSHFVWHAGVIGLAALLIHRAWKQPQDAPHADWPAILGGVLYGFLLFCIFLEGQTVTLGLPSLALGTLVWLVWGRKKIGRAPIATFFFVSCALALLLFTVWGLYWGGFPQFSDVGLI